MSEEAILEVDAPASAPDDWVTQAIQAIQVFPIEAQISGSND